jgi:meiotically up-regulated gene 157 (Mug157) protein
VANSTGLIRSAFRPSDDATIFQFYIPANMMFSSCLSAAAKIMGKLNIRNSATLAQQMTTMSRSLQEAIENHGMVEHPTYGRIYAFEVDGFGSSNTMDDANIPSLLSVPFHGYPVDAATYSRTRAFILSAENPYYMRGPVFNAVGGPHVGPGKAWPMASIMRILTSDDDDEIVKELRQILATTDGLGRT